MVQDFKTLHYVYGLAFSIYNHHISPIRTLYGILVTFQRRNSLHCKVFDDFSVTPKAFTNLVSYKPQSPSRYPHFFGYTATLPLAFMRDKMINILADGPCTPFFTCGFTV